MYPFPQSDDPNDYPGRVWQTNAGKAKERNWNLASRGLMQANYLPNPIWEPWLEALGGKGVGMPQKQSRLPNDAEDPDWWAKGGSTPDNLMRMSQMGDPAFNKDRFQRAYLAMKQGQ